MGEIVNAGRCDNPGEHTIEQRTHLYINHDRPFCGLPTFGRRAQNTRIWRLRTAALGGTGLPQAAMRASPAEPSPPSVTNYAPAQGPGPGNRPGPRYPRAVSLTPPPVYARAFGLVAGRRAGTRPRMVPARHGPRAVARLGERPPIAARVVWGVAGRRSVVHDRKGGGTWAQAWRRECRWTGPARPT
jgi:hypothetical protein